MGVFLSYSAADQKFAERLREELRSNGLSVWSDAESKASSAWHQQIEEAIRSADDILILVGPRSSDDEAQQFTWRVALEAVWEEDSDKRLIPILLRDTALPPFVYGDRTETRVVRIVNPRDVRSSAEAVLMALQRGSQEPSPGKKRARTAVKGKRTPLDGGSFSIRGKSGPRDPDPGSVDVGTKAGYSSEVDVERSGRLQEIEQFAERLKH